jgi:glycosyltransferase involved in cell wall biosynthesis
VISVVVCSITPAKLAAVKENLSRLLDAEAHEFIAIQDAKSLAEGYNRGVARSSGEILILCHDDIEILAPDFLERMIAERPGNIVVLSGRNRAKIHRIARSSGRGPCVHPEITTC